MTLALTPPDWTSHARCARGDVCADIFHEDDRHSVKAALSICDECPVTRECLAWALEYEATDLKYGGHGVWGHTTSEQRKNWRRRRPA